jgi:hypothetical protein
VTFADDQIVYRDLTGAWGSFRLIVGSKDVTRFRDVPAQIGGYQLQEPYGYGPADFSFPQITSLEVDQWGTGDLAWFDAGKTVTLVQVNETGARVRLVWKGFISLIDITDDGTAIHCDGDASGRLSMLDKHPELFTWVKDAGLLLADAFRKARLTTSPQLGTDTGIELDERRLSGGSLKDYCDGILAQSMKANGDQLTVMPDADGARYVQTWKDRTTVHASVFNVAAGVSLDLSRDLQEEPTTFYGSGRDSDGTLWVNGKYPGLIQGDPPPFPGTLSLGDSGDDVQTLQSKLVGMGYLSREDSAGNDFDAETEEAVKDLQDDAGLAETGVVNSATWDALFDLDDTGLSLRQAYQAPLAQLSAVRKWNRTSNGSKASMNDGYDPARIEVDRTLDGFGDKKHARRWCKRELSKVQTGKNYVGTITLSTDVVVGDHTHAENAPEGVMSRLDLAAGQNVRLHNFDRTTLFHVSGVAVDSDLTVRLAVDTKARDLMTVAQIRDRNAASRISPSRQWIREHRRSGAMQQIVEATEHFGRTWATVDCAADSWTVFPVIAGQSGTVNRISIKVTDSKCELVAAVLARKVSPSYMQSKIGNPFDVVGRLQNITVDAGGTGYTSAPTVSFSGGGGSGAKAVATVSGGAVTSVEFTQRGHGYTSAPSVSFSGGGGSGASATVTIGGTGSGAWSSDTVADMIDKQRILLGAWGDEEQPGGYWPGQKTGDDGTATGDPLTGVLLEDAGFPYRSLPPNPGVLYVAVYVKQACKIKPQRVLWPVLEAGM